MKGDKMELLNQDHCHPKEELGDCVGKVLALDGNLMLPDKQHLANQFWIATHGKGCYEGYQDTKIYVTSLYTKDEAYFDRSQFLGEVKEGFLPKLVRENRDKLLPYCHDEAFFLKAKPFPFEVHMQSRIHSQFNDTVLMVNLTEEKEVTFNICTIDEENEYIHENFAYGHDIDLAKREFVIRSGLVSEDLLLKREEKRLLMNCLDFAVDEGLELDYTELDLAEEMLDRYRNEIDWETVDEVNFNEDFEEDFEEDLDEDFDR